MHSDTSAFALILTADPTLLAIVRLSLLVSLSAVAVAALIGMPEDTVLGSRSRQRKPSR